MIYSSILKQLSRMLSESGNSPQQEVILSLINLAEEEHTDKFIKQINSHDMWGGAGSVLETTHGMSMDEGMKFREMLYNLLKVMKTDNIMGSTAKSAIKMLR